MTPATWTCPSPSGNAEEYALAFDSAREHRLLIVPALFDEANRMRRFTVEVMRRLDGAGYDCFLPDLPGANESLQPFARQTMDSWCAAMEDAADHFGATHVLAIRGGALIAPKHLPAWHYAPASGASILRQQMRVRVIAAREAGQDETSDKLMEIALHKGIELSGYSFNAHSFRQLRRAEPVAGATEILHSSLKGGAALWMRAEPGESRAQADELAAIVAIGVKYGDRPVASTPRKCGDLVLTRRSTRRSWMTFDSESSALVASLDHAPGQAGLLIVTGGNEIRAGAWNGQAQFAARIAAAGFPVFRFDRRGVGDSEGPNLGFRESARDIAAALAAFHEARPGLSRVVGMGNCDGASALMLAGGAGFDALVLSNPWTFEDEAAPAPAAVVRDHYRRRLADPAAIRRLLTGQVSLRKLFSSLRAAARPAPPEPTGLAGEMADGIAGFGGPVVFPLAARDRTGQAFLAQWRKDDPRLHLCENATHSYVEPAAQDWLVEQVLAVLKNA